MKSINFGRAASLALSITAFAAIAACSNPSQIHTRDGHTISTADRPEVDEDSDFVTYEKDGREVQLNKSDVQAIEEIK